MIVCLAALEKSNGLKNIYDVIDDNYLKYGLVSFYYLKQNEINDVLKKVNKVFVDSGAHSFQHGVNVDFEKYTDDYVEFIKQNENNDNILGFFEMDVDNVIGYDKVLELRKKLTAVSNKIIPVWHNNRGVKDFIDMCKEYSGRRVAITGFANNDITDGQYNLFINEAHKYNCTIHILGLTRFDLINTLNLGLYDSVDSSSWKQNSIFGGISVVQNKFNLKRFKCFEKLRINWLKYMPINFENAKRIQDNYLCIDNSIKGDK